MEKSKIWHDMGEKPTTKHASIYLLDADNDITTVFYCDESKTPWVNYRIYFCGIVAWAYAAATRFVIAIARGALCSHGGNEAK